MILLTEEKIKNLPVLHVVDSEIKDKQLPVVFYYHGFNGEKISSLTLAYKIAAKGYRVILPDALHHGYRKGNISDNALNLAFWDIVEQNIKEFEMLVADYTDKKLIDPNRIGVGGTSMGGITSYGLLATYPNIKVATVLMGTPYMSAYAKQLIKVYNKANTDKISTEETIEVEHQMSAYDLSQQREKLKDRPLLIWHGKVDEVVPLQHSQQFFDEIKDLYQNKNKLKFIAEEERAHHLSRLSMQEAADWFQKFL